MTEKVKIAVVGYGLIGKRHVAVISGLVDTEVAAVVEPSDQARSEAESFGYRVFATMEAMFEVFLPDGIVLATPTPLHIDQGLLSIEQGCPILIEKPIAVQSKSARLLTDAAEAKDVPLLVGHHRRHNGMVKAAKKAIDDGSIGDIRAVQATCWFYKPDSYFDIAPWRKIKGAGPISVNLVHDVDLLRHFCGEVQSVQAISVSSRRGFENEDLATAILTFEANIIATISVSDSIVGPWSWELTSRENPAYPATNQSCYLIGGSEGGLSLPDLRLWKHAVKPDWWSPIAATNLTCKNTDPLVVQMQHFAQVVRREEMPLVSGIEGLRSLEVVEAIDISATSGQEVTLGGTS